MDLYIYDHCPFCNRVRIVAGLLSIDLNLKYLANDDEATPKGFIGKKLVPILIKLDGKPMGESMEIVEYLNNLPENQFKLSSTANDFLEDWVSKFMPMLMRLTIPRSVKIDFKEFNSQAAKDYYIESKKEKFGDFEQLIKKSPEFIAEVEQELEGLEAYFVKSNYIAKIKKAKYDYADVNLYAFLRLATMVKGLNFPANVSEYLKIMQDKSKLELLENLAV